MREEVPPLRNDAAKLQEELRKEKYEAKRSKDLLES